MACSITRMAVSVQWNSHRGHAWRGAQAARALPDQGPDGAWSRPSSGPGSAARLGSRSGGLPPRRMVQAWATAHPTAAWARPTPIGPPAGTTGSAWRGSGPSLAQTRPPRWHRSPHVLEGTTGRRWSAHAHLQLGAHHFEAGCGAVRKQVQDSSPRLPARRTPSTARPGRRR